MRFGLIKNTANSRINTVYMTSYFIGGTIGSWVAIVLYNAGGWGWSFSFMLVLAVLIVINVVTSDHSRNRFLKTNNQPPAVMEGNASVF